MTTENTAKRQISIQLPPALIDWLDTLSGSRSDIIEDALVNMRGPMTADAPPGSAAEAVIAFFGSLAGLDFSDAPECRTVINLRTGMLIQAAPDFPDGEILRVSTNGHKWAEIYTHKLASVLLAQHAELTALDEGTKPAREYEHIRNHMAVKTGIAVD